MAGRDAIERKAISIELRISPSYPFALLNIQLSRR
jgi:hypothetical protein